MMLRPGVGALIAVMRNCEQQADIRERREHNAVAVSTSVSAAFDHVSHEGDEQRPHEEDVNIEQRDTEHAVRAAEEREEGVVEQQAAEQERRDQPLPLESRAHALFFGRIAALRHRRSNERQHGEPAGAAARAYAGASLSCSRIAGFSSVDTSCAMPSPLAIERSRRA